MRVLVTGADGHIGSVLGSYLQEHGVDTVRLDQGLFDFRAYTRLRQLEHLSETRQIDADCFWTWPGL